MSVVLGHLEWLDVAHVAELDEGGVVRLSVVFEERLVCLKRFAVMASCLPEYRLGDRVEEFDPANSGCCFYRTATLFQPEYIADCYHAERRPSRA